MGLTKEEFKKRLDSLLYNHKELVNRKNEKESVGNGIFDRYENPVLTDEHTPLYWRYDLNPDSNPYLMERLGINAVFNPGA